MRGHIANRDALHMALDAGIDVVDHGDGLDEAAIGRMVEQGTFLVPSQLFPARFAEMMGGGGLGFTAAMAEDIERALAILPMANEAGVKLLCGDDYGAIGLPHGRYADELEFYVKEAGIPPLDVLRWATRHGAELMGRGPRARHGAGRLPGRPARRRRRPARRHRCAPGPDAAARHHEGRDTVGTSSTRSGRRGRRRAEYTPAMIIVAGSMSFDAADRARRAGEPGRGHRRHRHDAGCLEYLWGEDLEDPNTFSFYGGKT